ncbi:MAG: chromosomal replication initiator protein DnaA [Magnetococcales bacterium]|nr:chromosomal replication initiator protein DnaA [Magnetococcales bacterium]
MDALWSQALALLQEQLAPQLYDAWIKPLRPAPGGDGSRLLLLAPSTFALDRVQSRFRNDIEQAVVALAGDGVKIAFQVDGNPARPESAPATVTTSREEEPPPLPRDRDKQETGLDPRYTFESFVVGGCNQFVHAAAARVAELPAKAYNPLFIHGGVGLGKTHIMQAIGNRLQQTRPELKILYISSEKFMLQLINSLRFQRVFDFKENFRSVDILLVDDIQFIAGKKATQEEFFHTFNALFEANKQIVLTSDSFPNEIEHLEERLRSRLRMGLVADMQPPELETRVAILKKKAAMEGLDLQDDVAFFLAEAIHSNVRDLIGALIRVSAYASLTRQPVTMGLVRTSMREMTRQPERQEPLSIERIQETVATFYRVQMADLHSTTRARAISRPRQIAMFLCKQFTAHSYPEIGRQFGGKDHTTVLYAVEKIEEEKMRNPQLAQELDTLSGQLRKNT